MTETLTISIKHWQEMVADVRQRYPLEACGLIAGRHGRTSRVIPIANELDSPVRFRMDPRQQLQALLEIDERGEELLAIYHSHPSGPAGPSPSDITEAAYPGVVHLIWHKQAGGWDCGGYLIEEERVRPVSIRMAVSPAGPTPGVPPES